MKMSSIALTEYTDLDKTLRCAPHRNADFDEIPEGDPGIIL